MDFTIEQYKKLLHTLKEQKYSFQTFSEFLLIPKSKTIILRHDVDLLPENSLRFAKIQNELGIKGTYYFRAVPESWDESIILEIKRLGHEIGYHYECLTTCDGDINRGIQDFKMNIDALRKLADVRTICMHGSPMSKHDSKDLWKKHDYKNFGILGEPYFDVDFDKVFYITDTGRRWNGDKVSVRDKVVSNSSLKFKYTNQIIEAGKRGDLPEVIMFTFHPQRWNDFGYLWTKEIIYQNIKNRIKKHFFVERTRDLKK